MEQLNTIKDRPIIALNFKALLMVQVILIVEELVICCCMTCMMGNLQRKQERKHMLDFITLSTDPDCQALNKYSLKIGRSVDYQNIE